MCVVPAHCLQIGKERHSADISLHFTGTCSELRPNVVLPDFRGFVILACKPLRDNVKSLSLSFLFLLIISKPFFFIALFIHSFLILFYSFLYCCSSTVVSHSYFYNQVVGFRLTGTMLLIQTTHKGEPVVPQLIKCLETNN